MTFSEWFEQFYKIYCDGILSYDCANEYRVIYEKHFYPIHSMKLEDIKPMHIQICLKTARNYSNSRYRKTYFQLKRIFNEAMFNDFCKDNPVTKCKPPKKIRKFSGYFSPEQLQMFLDSDTPTARMLHLELLTGLRRGELLGLIWDNINLDKGYIKVCQTLVRVSGGNEIRDTTKSNTDRLIPLNEVALEVLQQIKLKDSQEGFVFKSVNGGFMNLRTYHDKYEKYFSEQKEKHPELEYLTGHKLRHSFATYLLQCGSDVETVRALLGHTSISTTQIYVHTNYDRMKQATEHLEFK